MFKCEYCGDEFETKQKLNGHIMGKHRGERPEVSKRKERIPVGVKQYKLKSEHSPNKVGRWVNDRGNRLQRFLDGGYEYVEDPDATESSDGLGSKKSKVVDSNTGQKAYLMEIDKDLYDEDQEVKQAKLDDVDNRIKHGALNNKLGGAGYTKDGDGNNMIRYEPK